MLPRLATIASSPCTTKAHKIFPQPRGLIHLESCMMRHASIPVTVQEYQPRYMYMSFTKFIQTKNFCVHGATHKSHSILQYTGRNVLWFCACQIYKCTYWYCCSGDCFSFLHSLVNSCMFWGSLEVWRLSPSTSPSSPPSFILWAMGFQGFLRETPAMSWRSSGERWEAFTMSLHVQFVHRESRKPITSCRL